MTEAPKEPDTKSQILAAAEAEFLAKGYERARTKAIAERAGFNKALLHYHFRTKEELFACIFREKTGQLFPRVEQELRNCEDFIAFVCSFVEIYVAFLIENPLLPTYLLEVSTNHANLLEHIQVDFPSRFVAAFEKEVRAKRVRPQDARQFLISLVSMCVMPFAGRNLISHMLGLDKPAFDELVQSRAREIQRYVVLLLTPERDAA